MSGYYWWRGINLPQASVLSPPCQANYFRFIFSSATRTLGRAVLYLLPPSIRWCWGPRCSPSISCSAEKHRSGLVCDCFGQHWPRPPSLHSPNHRPIASSLAVKDFPAISAGQNGYYSHRQSSAIPSSFGCASASCPRRSTASIG